MKKFIIISLLFFLSSQLIEAQVLSNKNVNATIVAQNPFLDASTNFGNSAAPNNVGKGLVFPRTDLTVWTFKTQQLNGVSFPSAFDGMLVYNTGTGNTLTGTNNPDVSSSVTPGFYYFYNPGATTTVNQGKWLRLL